MQTNSLEDGHRGRAEMRGSDADTCPHPIIIFSAFPAATELEYLSEASSAHDGGVERRDG